MHPEFFDSQSLIRTACAQAQVFLEQSGYEFCSACEFALLTLELIRQACVIASEKSYQQIEGCKSHFKNFVSDRKLKM